MTHRAKTPSQTNLLNRPSAWKRKLFRGLAISAAVLGLGGAATLVPAYAPPNVTPPANKGLHLAVTESARTAYIKALLASGYEIMPPITLDQVDGA
jgi:hypothetical protein